MDGSVRRNIQVAKSFLVNSILEIIDEDVISPISIFDSELLMTVKSN